MFTRICCREWPPSGSVLDQYSAEVLVTPNELQDHVLFVLQTRCKVQFEEEVKWILDLTFSQPTPEWVEQCRVPYETPHTSYYTSKALNQRLGPVCQDNSTWATVLCYQQQHTRIKTTTRSTPCAPILKKVFSNIAKIELNAIFHEKKDAFPAVPTVIVSCHPQPEECIKIQL
jgi:hypothetical protein